jgi:hypothetical protein
MRLILPLREADDQLRRFVCPLFVESSGRNSGCSPWQIGTAVLFREGSSSYLLTAAHVLVDAGTADLLVGTFGGMPGTAPFMRLQGSSIRTREVRTEGIDYDVSAIVLDQGTAAPINKFGIFVEPADVGNADADVDGCDARYVLYGFPHSANRPVRPGKELRFRPYRFHSSKRASPESVSRSGKSHTTHIGLVGKRKVDSLNTGREQFPPCARGMSGGGVWKLHVDNRGLVMRCRLVGIFIDQVDEHGQKMFCATRAEWALLAQLFFQHAASAVAVLDGATGTKIFTAAPLPPGTR